MDLLQIDNTIILLLLLIICNYVILEYPGHNYTEQNILKTYWEIYYDCLKKDYDELGETKQRKLRAKIALPGQWIVLNCETCHPPFEDVTTIKWKYQNLQTPTKEPEILDTSTEYSIFVNNTLQIMNLRPEHSGIYQCFRGNNLLAGYVVEIPESINITEITSEQAEAIIPEDLPYMNTTVTIVWGKWTECSRCDNIGLQYQYGLCYINFNSNHSKNIDKSWAFYKDGLPCASQFLPSLYKQAIFKINASNYVITKFCKETCKKSHSARKLKINPELLKGQGISDTLNILKGEFPEVKYQILDVNFMSRVVLQCPQISNKNVPITWKINGMDLLPEIVANDSNGRIKIDILNRLIIDEAHSKDSREYSCFQKDSRVGSILLYVNLERDSMDQKAMIAAAILITLVLIMIAVKAKEHSKSNSRNEYHLILQENEEEEFEQDNR